MLGKKSYQTAYSLSEENINVIKEYYTPNCSKSVRKVRWTDDLFLSPRSYFVIDNANKPKGLGVATSVIDQSREC